MKSLRLNYKTIVNVLIATCLFTFASPLQAKVTYELAKGHNDWPKEKKEIIIKSMDEAVAIYNRFGNLKKKLKVTYNPAVPTADGNMNGSIRFGGTISTRVALHEIAHTIGVGQHGRWKCLIKEGLWQGKRANRALAIFDGKGAKLNADGFHFWPYGLNYDNEANEVAYMRHVILVSAFFDDLKASTQADCPPPKVGEGVYWKYTNSNAVHWSKDKADIKKDVTFSSPSQYFDHRRKHGWPADWSNIRSISP